MRWAAIVSVVMGRRSKLWQREDGGEDLVGFGGGEDEFHVLRRLLQGLEEGVKGGCGEYVDLIDVIDPEFPAGGGEADGFAELADFIDAVVRGTVDFEDIERAAFGDFDAEVVIGIEIRLRSAGAVEGLGEDAGGGGFPGAAGADEEVGVGEAVLGDGVAQRADDVVLAEDVIEGAGTVFPGEDLVAHAGDSRKGRPGRERESWGNRQMTNRAGGSRRGC